MRFGGNILQDWSSPDEWAQIALDLGYSAVYFPLDYTASIRDIDEYKQAADDNNLIIAEVGVWNNTLTIDSNEKQLAIEKCIKQLELADYVGAKCCVNIAGSKSSQWDGPHRDNYSKKTYDEIVDITQTILDTAKPKNTYYTLEPMPWIHPDSIDSYLCLIKDINRDHFAAHLDPVNIITSPQLYYNNSDFLIECFDRLGPYIRSIHAKDIIIGNNLTIHFDECRPGLGALDYETFIMYANKLDIDTPFMLEHMDKAQDYIDATEYIKSLAKKQSINI